MSLPKQFSSKELQPVQTWDDETGEPKFKPADFEALQAYLASFPFVWKIRVAHDEPCGSPWVGGPPQIRLQGTLEGDGVRFGTFEVAFGGRRIEVKLPPERQALFENRMKQLEVKK